MKQPSLRVNPEGGEVVVVEDEERSGQIIGCIAASACSHEAGPSEAGGDLVKKAKPLKLTERRAKWRPSTLKISRD